MLAVTSAWLVVMVRGRDGVARDGGEVVVKRVGGGPVEHAECNAVVHNWIYSTRKSVGD